MCEKKLVSMRMGSMHVFEVNMSVEDFMGFGMGVGVCISIVMLIWFCASMG